MINRTLAPHILQISKNFPVLLVTGPRQVGKTTLLQMCSDEQRAYVTLDDLEARRLAEEDPVLFLQAFPPPVIIDEIQYAPQLFSAIKVVVDKEKKNGLFWLTGSQKFNLMKGITESLAGRVAILDLLGFSQAELAKKQQQPFLPTSDWLSQAHGGSNLKDTYLKIWLGSFPHLYENDPSTRDIFYRSYIQTYIQRDVKDILHITDELSFYKFLTALASRSSQLLNLADLGRDVGIDSKTAKSWLSVLETSGLIYLLQPYSNNLSNRLVKSPKAYFLDTGLYSYLTKWPTPESLEAGAMSAAILETYLFSEILKSYWHHAKDAPFFYYRDLDKQEIDLIIEIGDTLYPVEFKKTAAPSKSAFNTFSLLEKLGKNVGPGAVICFVEKAIPLSRTITAIPVGAI